MMKMKFCARNSLADHSNHEHLADVIYYPVATITLTDCHNHYMNIRIKLRAILDESTCVYTSNS